MSGYIDLHAHWVPGIDDGVGTVAEGVELLRGLASIGFARAVATPHMRPGMFDNSREVIESTFARMAAEVAGTTGLPELGVASEHYLDDVVYQRLLAGKGVPLPGGQAVLVELHADIYPVRLADRILDLRRRKLRPVIAHPERYAAVAERASVLDEAIDAGAALQLDIAALVGKYGRRPQRAAEKLLDEGYYHLASSDAHRPRDVEAVARGIARLVELAGPEEAGFLLREGPRRLLEDPFGP